jgi:hypothetical protein
MLSAWTNLLFGSHVTDEPTGMKSFRRSALDGITLAADGFDFDPELTARLLQAGHTIHEIPVRYQPRTFKQGKKVRPRDGLARPLGAAADPTRRQAESRVTTVHANRRQAWHYAVLFALLALAFLLGCFPMGDFDVWWHLRSGQLILERGEVPRTDWFSLYQCG